MNRWRIRLVAGLLAGFSLAGCASFRQGKLPEVTNWPPPASHRGTARIAVTGQVYSNGDPAEGMGMVLDWWSKHVLAMYAESGLFSQVQLGRGSADRFIQVNIQQKSDASIGMAILSGLTLTLVPSITYNSIAVKTTVTDAEGNQLGTVEKEESVNTWIELFMVFPMFTNFPTRVIIPTLDDLNRASIAEAHQRDLF